MPQILVQDDRNEIEKSDSENESARHTEQNVGSCVLIMPCYISAKRNCRQQGENPQQHSEDIADGVPPLKIGVGLHVEISGRTLGREPLMGEAGLR